MIMKYQIFTNLQDLENRNEKINILFDYPNDKKTIKYENEVKHPTDDKWYGAVDEKLIEKCSTMTEEERLEYYDESKLVDYQFLKDNGWIIETIE